MRDNDEKRPGARLLAALVAIHITGDLFAFYFGNEGLLIDLLLFTQAGLLGWWLAVARAH